jgi:hypothetical protein
MYMSLDFSLEKTQPTEVYSGNMTHNVSPMWDLAGIYDDLYNSDGKKADDIVINLWNGYNKMVKNPKKFQKLNPENGWGSYETALTYLKEIIDACGEYPEAIIRISK